MWPWESKEDGLWALQRRLKRLENAFIELEGEMVDIRSANMRLLGRQGAITKQSPNKKLERLNKDLVSALAKQAGMPGNYETVAVFEPTEEPTIQEGKPDGTVPRDRPDDGKGNNDKR